MSKVNQFGVLIVGDEILRGKRTDKHLSHVIHALQAQGLQVAWSRVVGDDRKRLVRELKLTQLDSLPVLCFGGIGASPDDQTRQAAGEAFATRLQRHPGALAMIERQFGAQAYPNRVRMADLPQDCLLIPNHHNRIPGFTLYDHHFFPGFPFMAWPMLDWVLDNYYSYAAPLEVEKSVRVLHASESELFPLMYSLSANHSRTKLFSLPHMAGVKTIELGFSGEQAAVDIAYSELLNTLKARAVEFECLHEESGANVFRSTTVP